eukprot:CAMPEP_0172496978 /NCGR_PEP_ID=MMETSP1066-20121228/94728_1 /TAXON_ID=671091 /ORGANISM="Coscinodiscus wailesii, Strain CCMP2513" /LENGTH=35 /DNA_ID= /DNA_START= /DNA_END= /DNA_ORIENTATION=
MIPQAKGALTESSTPELEDGVVVKLTSYNGTGHVP